MARSQTCNTCHKCKGISFGECVVVGSKSFLIGVAQIQNNMATSSIYCGTQLDVEYSILSLNRRIIALIRWFQITLIILGCFVMAWALAVFFAASLDASQ